MVTPKVRPAPARTRADETPRPARFGVLDGLRFVAALSVLAFHFTARESEVWGTSPGRAFPTLSDYSAYGTLGVEFFFVISGFVILMTAWDKPVTSYVASRIGRLFPAYWAAAALSALLLMVLWPEGRPTDLGEVLVNLTMLHEAWGVHRLEGVYWTLWIELRFYVLIGVFMLVGMTPGRILAFSALWPLAAALSLTTDSPLLQTILMPTHAPLFAGGMMLYFIHRQGHSLLAWLVVAINAVFAANAADHGAVGRIDEITAIEHSSVAVWLVTLASFALVAVAALTPLREVRWRWLTVIGALTYPLYLVHEFWGRYIIQLLTPHSPKYAVLLVATGLTVVLAWAIHLLVERPLAAPLRRTVERTLVELSDGDGRTRSPHAEVGAGQIAEPHPVAEQHLAAVQRFRANPAVHYARVGGGSSPAGHDSSRPDDTMAGSTPPGPAPRTPGRQDRRNSVLTRQ